MRLFLEAGPGKQGYVIFAIQQLAQCRDDPAAVALDLYMKRHGIDEIVEKVMVHSVRWSPVAQYLWGRSGGVEPTAQSLLASPMAKSSPS